MHVTKPEMRAEAVAREVLSASMSLESEIQALMTKAVASAMATERANCARLLDSLRDELVDWLSSTGKTSPEQMQIANMLSRAAAMLRGELPAA